MRVVVLVLEILCTLGGGVLTILSNNLFSEIIWLIFTTLCGVSLGECIKDLISNR